MKAGMKEQITGYLGELSVERVFLLRDINCRRGDFSVFDAVVDDNSTLYRLQVKCSARGRWSVTGGRNRKKQYKLADVDGIALVALNRAGDDDIAFFTMDEIDKRTYTKDTVPVCHFGEKGWDRFKQRYVPWDENILTDAATCDKTQLHLFNE